MGISNILSNKPSLYYYTNPDTLTKVIASRSVWARPIWDFKATDVDEYVLGLRLISQRLKDICNRGAARTELPPATNSLMARCGVDAYRVLQETISHVEYELAHDGNCKVQIYVACVSTNAPSFSNPEAVRMLQEYGECVIQFNWMLPLLCYAWPRPFVMSMLSRVSYSEEEFWSFIPTVIDIRNILADPNSFENTHIKNLPLAERASFLATTFAIYLCAFAANIKQPEFSYEHEWRLKTIDTSHASPLLERDKLHWLRGLFKLPEDAEFSPTTPRRYVQQLTFHGRMIVYPNVGILKRPPIAPEFANQVREIQDKLRQLEARYGGVLGEAAGVRDELLRLERDGYGGLSPDKPIV